MTRSTWALAMVVLLAACGGGGGTTDASPSTIDAHAPDAPVPDGGTPGAPPTATCRDTWCWVLPTPQGNPLRGLWGAAADDVWALGDHGTIIHYDGAGWSATDPGASWGAGEGALWGSGSSDVWAAAGTAGLLHWNGAAWSSAQTGDVLVVGGTGAADVWAYDFTAKNIRQWDGAWHTRALPAAGWRPIAFGGVSGASMAVSADGGIAKWLGNAWGIADAGTHAANAAAIIDGTHVVLAQDAGNVAFWDGNTWTVRTAPVAANWSAIAATSLDDVWVSGQIAGTRSLYHWNGATWSAADDPGEAGVVEALWRDPAGDIWEARNNAEVSVWNGTVWTAKTSANADVEAVWGTADDDLWVVGLVTVPSTTNRVLHWNGVAWSDLAFPYGAAYTLGRTWGVASDDFWIAAGKAASGNQVDRVLLHRSGGVWSEAGPFGQEDGILGPAGFTSIWGASASDIYAIAPTALYHYNGSGWSVVASVPGGTDVFGTATDDVYVLNGATVWRWNGATWTSKTSPAAVDRGWATASNDIWLQGQSSSSSGVHYDGTTFFSVYQAVGGEGLPVGTATDMFTFHYASGEHMTRWVGGFSGTTMVTPLFFLPTSGWVTPSGHVYAAAHGLLVH